MYSKKETVKVLLYDLKPHPKNPKKHNDALIEKSISELGYAENIVIDENNVILAGHGRVEAIKKTGGVEAGGMEIEAVKITGWTEEEKEKYLLLSNQTTMLGGFDELILSSFEPTVLSFSGVKLEDNAFQPDEEGLERLDKKKMHKCPECQYEFED